MNKYLICISSYKRPVQLLGQVHRFNKQTYSNIDISVVVRGCDKAVYNIIVKELSIYNNIIISCKDNNDQLNNLLDCIRQVNKKDYDYFCKVDDDDIYSLDYIYNINEKIKNITDSKVIGFYNNQPLPTITDNTLITHSKNIIGLYGNTLGFNGYVYSILEEISSDVSNIKSVLKKYNLSIKNPNQYITNKYVEDKLIDHIMDGLNSDQNKYLNIDMKNQVYYCRLSEGVMRI